MPSDVLLDWPQSRRLQSLSKGWIYPSGIVMLAELFVHRPVNKPIVEATQVPLDARSHHPYLWSK